jgi:hypothetical protein
MRATIEFSDDLSQRVEEYLRAHHEVDLNRLIERAVEREIAQPDPEALLALCDIVGRFPRPNAIPMEERQPEDRVTDYVR